MEARALAVSPATPPAAGSRAVAGTPTAAPSEPQDEVEIQSLLGAGSRFHIPSPEEMAGYPHRGIPDGSKRIDVLKDVLHLDQVHAQGITGKGVTVCVIDTGIYPHEDLKTRIIGWKDLVNDRPGPYDDNGHGTHCSGLVAGNGHMAGGRFMGAAPEANLVGVKVLSGEGGGAMSDVIRGLEWAVANKARYNIRVISMSLGAPSFQKETYDLVAEAVKQAHDAGIVVCVAAGNEGPGLETIGTPALSSSALTVGAYDDKNTADVGDDTMAYFSSRGPTTRDRTAKPDIASPGVNLVSTRSPGSAIDQENIPRYGDDYILLSGTSMATPVMAGIAADIIQANPKLTPDQVKEIVKATGRPLADTNPLVQGAGLVDPVAAVNLALAMKAAAPEQPAAREASATKG